MRKFLALILLITLVFPLVLSAQALISVGSFVLDRQFYIGALDNDQLYDSLISETIVSSFLNRGLSLPVGTDTARLESVMESILPREYLKPQIDLFVNGFFDYLQGRSEDFSPTLDISSIKNALQGEKQSEFLLALAEAMPPCETDQIPGFGGEGQTACKPEGMSIELLAEDYLKPVFPQALAQFPDQILLVENWEELQGYRSYRSFMPGMAVPASLMLIVLIFVFLALCTWYLSALIADDSWRTRLQWLGWTLIIPSALIFLVGLAAASNIPAYWANFGLERANFRSFPLDPGLQVAARVIVQGSFPRISSAFMMVGGISAAFSLGLIFWGLATSGKRQRKEEA